jgi:hypothetical protein
VQGRADSCAHVYRTVEVVKSAYEEKIVSASVSAFAQALATAVDTKDGVHCSSSVDVGVSSPNSSAKCWSATKVFDDNSVTNAITKAGASLNRALRMLHVPKEQLAFVQVAQSCMDMLKLRTVVSRT